MEGLKSPQEEYKDESIHRKEEKQKSLITLRFARRLCIQMAK